MEITINEMRKKTGLSQSKFAAIYDIPVRNIQKWERGESNPPKYLLFLLNKSLMADGYYNKINMELSQGKKSKRH